MQINKSNLIARLMKIRTSNDSYPFDYELSLKDPELNPLVREVLTRIGRAQKKDPLHLSVILANLLKRSANRGLYAGFSRSESKLPSSINGFELSRYRVKKLVDLLIEANLIEYIEGYFDEDTQRTSRIRAGIDLIDLAQSIIPEELKLARPKNRECIRLKDFRRRHIDYTDTNRIERKRNRLLRYNRLLEDTEITLNPDTARPEDIEQTDFSQKFTYRVFNDSNWKRGGRFYGGWWVDDIPSGERQHILIDGLHTVEIDFSNMHLMLLYAKKGINYGDRGEDGYALPHYSNDPIMRKVVKKAFTIALNCESEERFVRAFRKDHEERAKKAERDNRDFDRFPDSVLENPLQVLVQFRKYHPEIAHYLCSPDPIGLYLQYVDSQIADEIIRVMTKQKIPVLCIHDSFICAAMYEVRLVEAMRQAYARIVKQEFGVTLSGKLSLKTNLRGKESPIWIGLP